MAGLDERDELNAPLGLGPRKAPSRLKPAYAGAAAAALLIAGFGFLALRNPAPFGGEPYAVALIKQPPPPAPVAPPPSTPAAPAADLPTGSIATSTQVENASGVKVTRAGGLGAPNAVIIDVPQALGVQLTPAPDQRLVEKSRYGLLPRIGARGERPAEVYARPILTAAKLKAGAPRIAVLVNGVGVSFESTNAAIHSLPAAVSLAFAPYGATIERDASDAREAGHETFLQAPMEPIDYPRDNPGAHTLLTSLAASENIDNLRWMMTRFTGYVGVTNFLGAKFTASADGLSPVLDEIARRGLAYVDDGTSPRSVAHDVAASVRLPESGVDVVIDADQRPQAVSAALARLETLARANGYALGGAAALPATMEQIERWAPLLESRGIALVPVSALVGRGPGPAAQADP